MRYFVTGGAGFIGSNFIRYVLDASSDNAVVCFDKFTYAGNKENLQGLSHYGNRLIVLEGDITNREQVFKAVEDYNPDVIVNFAAESHVDNSIQNPSLFFQTNVVGTSVLLDATNHYLIKRFHQISTDEVYGDLSLDSNTTKFSEQDLLKPSSPYATSKASADLLVLAYHRTYQTPVTISRASNNYGPYQHPEKFIPCMVFHATKDKPLPLYGNGKNVRDWMHVLDHCRAVDKIIRKGKVGEIYNVGANNELSNLLIAEKILTALHKDKSLITYVSDRPGHDLRYALSSDKLQTELGWKPQVSFQEGLQDTISWYNEHTDWLASVKMPKNVRD